MNKMSRQNKRKRDTSTNQKPRKKMKKSLNRKEIKFADFLNIVAVGPLGVIEDLTRIAAGTTISERVGLSINVKNIFGRMIFTKDPAAEVTNIRCIIFKDKQQINGATPVITDVLQGSSVVSSYSMQSKGRFEILWDKNIDLKAGSNQTETFKINLPVADTMQYSGTANTTIQKNGLYVLFLSNATLFIPSCDYNLRIKFTDP